MKDFALGLPVDRSKRGRSNTPPRVSSPVAKREAMSSELRHHEEPEASAMSNEGRQAMDDALGNLDILKMLFRLLGMRDLSRAAVVCKTWKQVSYSDELWNDIDFQRAVKQPNLVLRILRKHPNATSVRMVGVPLDTFTASLIFSQMRRVTRLEMGGGCLTDCFSEGTSAMINLRSWAILEADFRADHRFIVHGIEATVISQDSIRELRVEKCVVGHLTITSQSLRFLSLRDSCLLHLQLSCPLLQSLDLQGCQVKSDPSLRTMLGRLPNLTDLNVSHMKQMTDEALRAVANTSTGLKSLAAAGCNHLLLTNLEGFRELQTADFSSCDGLVAETLVGTVENWTSLQSLGLSSCRSLSQLSLSNTNLQSIFLQNCPGLSQVSLHCPRLERVLFDPPFCRTSRLKQITISSDSIRTLNLCGLPNLKTVTLRCSLLASLDASCCHLLEESVLANFGDSAQRSELPGFVSGEPPLRSRCPNIRLLKLENCSSLIKVDLASLSLEELSLAGCKNLRQLDLVAPQLQELALDECDQLTDINITPIAVRKLSLGTCPRLLSLRANAQSLLSLDLKGCGMLNDLQLRCPELATLDCTYCRSLPDAALTTLCQAAPRLSSLVLSVCSAIGRGGLLSLQNLAHLRVLDLSYTDIEALDPVMEACPRLVTLKLHSCSSLKEDALQPLLEGPSVENLALPHLTDLDISYCNRLSTAQLVDLLLRGKRLQSVAVNGCEGFTSGVCQALHDNGQAGGCSELVELSAKTCKGLKSFWLGAQPPVDAEKKLIPPGAEVEDPSVIQEWWLQKAEMQLLTLPTLLTGLRVLKLALASLRSLCLALPNLAVLDVSSCTELWRLQLDCPKLEAAYFQSCRSLPTSAILDQLRGSPALLKLGLKHAEIEEHLADILKSWRHKLEIVPNPT